MRIALDTNRYSDVVRGDPAVVQIVENALEVYMPFPVVAELRAGFLGGSRQAANEQALAQFFNQKSVTFLPADEQTTFHFAQVLHQLRQQGTPIPINDIWIAALVIQHGLILYTRDSHFDHLPQIPRI